MFQLHERVCDRNLDAVVGVFAAQLLFPEFKLNASLTFRLELITLFLMLLCRKHVFCVGSEKLVVGFNLPVCLV